jgi:hypothetical protein
MINFRNLLFIALFLTNIFVYSQVVYAFSLETIDGVVINDNEVLEFSEITYPDASFGFYVRNDSSEDINVKVEVTSMSGTDGSLMELCFGECYVGITLNQSYPSNSFVTIAPNETQSSSGDHFFNEDPGDGSTPVEYTFRFYMVDQDGNEVVSIPELSTELWVGYYYSATLSVDDFDQINATFSHSNGVLKIHSEKQYQLNIYDIRGSLIIEKDIEIGDNYINSSIIPNHLYLLNFREENGTSIFKKIILN